MVEEERWRRGKTTWIDAAGKKRRLTKLQEKIANYRIDHPEAGVTEIKKEVGCSNTAVYKTLNNPLLRAREEGIQGEIDKAKVASIQERQEKLTEIIRAKITDYLDKDGNFEVRKESPNQAAIAEFSLVRVKGGQQRKLKLHSVIEAIEALDREEGIGRQPLIADQRSINITHVTVVEHPQVGEGKVTIEGESLMVLDEKGAKEVEGNGADGI